jgi:hypothetical protein
VINAPGLSASRSLVAAASLVNLLINSELFVRPNVNGAIVHCSGDDDAAGRRRIGLLADQAINVA